VQTARSSSILGGSGSFEIEGIFREAGTGVDINLAAEVRSDAPELHIKTAAVLEITGETEIHAGDDTDAADEVTVRGIRYIVAELDTDGEGMTVLFLKEGIV
jgi:hypothetical protein